MQISESDWRIFKRFYDLTLERFSQRILDELLLTVADEKRTAHERYLDVWKRIRKADKRIAAIFDNHYRRSQAVLCLEMMFAEKLLNEEDLTEFSDELRRTVMSRPGVRS